MKPCPTDLPQTINPEAGPKRAGVEAHRNLNCYHYDGCLDEAVRRGWQSFTCMKCPLYSMAAPPQVTLESYATQRRPV
ncbi:MAG: hypothetical protein L0Y64_24105, partial [Myxococcaceae bacterium]|nr:hypothetical protein [Myxococcaceae bacterium]